MHFTVLETLMVNLRSGHVRALDDSSEHNDRDSGFLPALRYLIVYRHTWDSVTLADELKESWEIVHGVMRYRASIGLPIAVLTLAGFIRLLDGQNKPEAPCGVDFEHRQILAELVGKVVDKRIWRSIRDYPCLNYRRALDSYHI